MRNVSSPVLILHGASDVLVPVAEAQVVCDDIDCEDKTLKVYAAGTPGCAHCQLDALAIAPGDICDRLDDTLRS